MKYSLITAVLACSLAACGGTDSSLISQTQKAVQAKLKDPDSAKFGDTFVLVHEENPGEDSGVRKVCGDVAAKNSYGAYDGRIRFVAFFGKPLGGKDIELHSLDIEPVAGDRIFDITWNIDCKKAN